jgi:hypothetical protein
MKAQRYSKPGPIDELDSGSFHDLDRVISGSTLEERFQWQKGLSEMEYGKFLKSKYWKIIASELKRRALWGCRICNKEERNGAKLHVHHRTYDRRGYEFEMMEMEDGTTKQFAMYDNLSEFIENFEVSQKAKKKKIIASKKGLENFIED